MATFAQGFERGPFFIEGSQLTDGKLYHYAAGTTTLKNLWTGRDKTATASQPLTSDANGMFSAYGDGLYKFVLTDADDAVLYTWDNFSVTEQQVDGEGAAIASAATLVLGTDGNFFHVTGTTNITAISGTISRVTLLFDDVLTLTNSGNLVLNGGVNHTTVANEIKEFINDGGGVWREIALGLDQVVVDIKVKKASPLIRLLDTGSREYGIRVTSDDFQILENTGSEATPTWTARAIYDYSLTQWALTGDLTVSGGILAPTIADLTNATHDHTTAAEGGILTGNAAIAVDSIYTFSLSGASTATASTATVTITAIAGTSVMVVATATLESTSVAGGADDRLRVYRDTTGNTIAFCELGSHAGALANIPMTAIGVDTPDAGSRTYTVDFVRPTAGGSVDYGFRNVTIAVFAVV